MKVPILLVLGWLGCCVPDPAHALTAQEVLLLKQNGVSDQTIQMMLQSEIAASRNAAAGQEMGVKTITRPNGKTAIVYSTGNGDRRERDAEERLKEERAWEMLRHIVVDTREKDKRRGTREDGRCTTE